jgi:uncharacterized protein YcbK (DUF882 family)
MSRAGAAARMGLRALLGLSAAVAGLLLLTRGTQDAVANGDTRTLSFIQEHTKDAATITFKRNGSYDPEALKELNWLLRDWRLDEQTRMDPRLFDTVWAVYREVGSREPIHIVSGYRSPQTNSMLRRRSKAVSEQSQHMRGKAMDFFLPDVPMSRVREVGMRLQDGGVGFYPNSANPFVHLDVGSVRAWPRMSRDQLVRLFPNGKTVHLPRDGKPLEGYELAKAEVLAKGGSVGGVTTYAEEDTGSRKSLWAMLFGGGEDEDAAFYQQRSRPTSRGTVLASAGEDSGTRGLFSFLKPQQGEPTTGGLRGGNPGLPDEEPAPGFEAREGGASMLQPVPSTQVAAAPVPPRRPEEVAPLLAEAPMPPMRPVMLASLGGSAPVVATDLKGQMRSPNVASARVASADERQALRALFEAAVTPTSETRHPATSRARPHPLVQAGPIMAPASNVRMVFSSVSTGELSPNRFSGPAVAPLPLLR